MPNYAGSAKAVIAAPPQDVWELMLDYERLPEWLRSVRAARVLALDEQGRASEVAYEIDVRVGVVRYTLRHHYDPLRSIRSDYVGGDFRSCRGEWTFRDLSNGTTEACFALEIDPGRAIPGPIRRMMSQRVMKGSVEDLRRRFAA
jgi:ribosome-associated toxin RatA of RatAB toxin-antitoxin module